MLKDKGSKHPKKWHNRRGLKDLKNEGRTKNRAATRQAIHHEQFEDFTKTKPLRTGNPWNWD